MSVETKSRSAIEVEKKLKSKIIAVGSGKGGVGKSTTVLNTALFFTRKGYRVCVIDLDPLSNTAVILDIETHNTKGLDRSMSFDDAVMPVFKGFDLLFPAPKTGSRDPEIMRDLVFNHFSEELVKRYDLILLDMPAGIGGEENLAFLPFIQHLVVVVVPQPTSHVSAGGFVKAALEINPAIQIHMWFNKDEKIETTAFHHRQVFKNYNRYVSDDLKLPENFAPPVLGEIPYENSLDLLQSQFNLEGAVMAKLCESLDVLQRWSVERKALGMLPSRLVQFIGNHPEILDMRHIDDEYLEDLKPGQREKLKSILENPARARLCSTLVRCRAAFAKMYEKGQRIVIPYADIYKNLQNSFADAFSRNTAGLILVYASFLRLVEQSAVRKRILEFVPRKQNAKGDLIRDRHSQIRSLVEKNENLHRGFFNLVKLLFPLFIKQIQSVGKKLQIEHCYFSHEGGNINRNAYLSLLGQVLHDMLHSGLGVFIGFRFNRSSKSLENAAGRLASLIHLQSKERK